MNIEKLVKFMYSSCSADDIQFRIYSECVRYCNFNFSPDRCKALLGFLDNHKNYNKEILDNLNGMNSQFLRIGKIKKRYKNGV